MMGLARSLMYLIDLVLKLRLGFRLVLYTLLVISITTILIGCCYTMCQINSIPFLQVVWNAQG